MSIPLSLHALYEKMKLTAAALPDPEKNSTTSPCAPMEDRSLLSTQLLANMSPDAPAGISPHWRTNLHYFYSISSPFIFNKEFDCIDIYGRWLQLSVRTSSTDNWADFKPGSIIGCLLIICCDV